MNAGPTPPGIRGSRRETQTDAFCQSNGRAVCFSKQTNIGRPCRSQIRGSDYENVPGRPCVLI